MHQSQYCFTRDRQGTRTEELTRLVRLPVCLLTIGPTVEDQVARSAPLELGDPGLALTTPFSRTLFQHERLDLGLAVRPVPYVFLHP